jgi:hypothetical protein
MTTINVELPDLQAVVLRDRAAAHGLSLEDCFQKLAFYNPVQGPRNQETIDRSQCDAMESVPGKASGAWVLKGRRMPVSARFENLEAGANVDEIMEWFCRPGSHAGRCWHCVRATQPGRAADVSALDAGTV